MTSIDEGDVRVDTRQRLLDVLAAARTIDAATAYYEDHDDGPAFSGSLFEVLGGPGDAEDVRDIVTPQDLVAITTLSVRFTGHGAIRVLHREASAITALLRRIPVTASPWTDEGQTLLRDVNSPLYELWALFRGIRGPVTAGKLCARKRPALVPIYDSVVAGVLKPPAREWWKTVADLMMDDEVHAAVTALHDTLAPIALERRGVELTPLRAVDIAVWMVGRRQLQADVDET